MSTASLSPCTTLKTPSGKPGLAATSRAISIEAEGSRSLGLSTKVLPQAIATGNIHIGTIAGKLNGVMPATTPERLAEGVGVDVGRDLVGVVTLEQARDAAGELDDLEPALHLAQRVGEHLAVLVGDQLGDLAWRGR